MLPTPKRPKASATKPSQHSQLGHDVPMNEPTVVDVKDPGLFVGIEIKPSANEKQTRQFRQRMREINKKLDRLDYLFPAMDAEVKTAVQDTSEREAILGERDTNQDNIEIMRTISGWLAAVSFDLDTVGIPLSEEGLKVSNQLYSDGNRSLCRAFEELQRINNGVMAIHGYNSKQSGGPIADMCGMNAKKLDTSAANRGDDDDEFHPVLSTMDWWKVTADELNEVLIRMRRHKTKDIPLMEDKAVRLIQCLGEQRNIVVTLQRRLERRTGDLNRVSIRLLVTTESFKKLQDEYLSSVDPDDGKSFLTSLEDEQVRQEAKLKAKEKAASALYYEPLIDEASLTNPYLPYQEDLENLKQENAIQKQTLKKLMSTYKEQDAIEELTAEVVRLTKLSLSTEKRFQAVIAGQRIEDIYKVENERLFFEVTNLLNITGDMKGRVRQLEHEKQVLIEDMEKLQQQIVPAQPE